MTLQIRYIFWGNSSMQRYFRHTVRKEFKVEIGKTWTPNGTRKTSSSGRYEDNALTRSMTKEKKRKQMPETSTVKARQTKGDI